VPDWVVHDVAASLRVVAVAPMPPLPPVLEAEVARLWDAAHRRQPGLFNGRIFSADTISPDLISGHWTEFRRSMAQIERPALYGALRVRSLAVNGVIRCAEGVLIGRRSTKAVYQAGQWQLPPAGSVDGGAEREDGSVDVGQQLRDELEEELGLPADRILAIEPLCLVEHPGTHVTDLGMAIRLDVDAATLLRAHATSGNQEYEEMHVLPIDRVLSLGADLMPTVVVFLQRLLARDAAP
jgi:8-oxo-dGTP pyrophosphatase MutT (NUDIX family)